MANTNLEQELTRLAKKYYGTSLDKLHPYQLDKVTNWATNTNPEKHGKIKGRKYSGKTYNKVKQLF